MFPILEIFQQALDECTKDYDCLCVLKTFIVRIPQIKINKTCMEYK